MLLGWDILGVRWVQTLYLSCLGCGQELRDEGKSCHAETPMVWALCHPHRPASLFLSETKHLMLLLSNNILPLNPAACCQCAPWKEKKKSIKNIGLLTFSQQASGWDVHPPAPPEVWTPVWLPPAQLSLVSPKGHTAVGHKNTTGGMGSEPCCVFLGFLEVLVRAGCPEPLTNRVLLSSPP